MLMPEAENCNMTGRRQDWLFQITPNRLLMKVEYRRHIDIMSNITVRMREFEHSKRIEGHEVGRVRGREQVIYFATTGAGRNW
jgi:hypothetical protein